MNIVKAAIINANKNFISGHIDIDELCNSVALTLSVNGKEISTFEADKIRPTASPSLRRLGFRIAHSELKGAQQIVISYLNAPIVATSLPHSDKAIVRHNSAARKILTKLVVTNSYNELKNEVIASGRLINADLHLLIGATEYTNPTALLHCLLAIRTTGKYESAELLEQTISRAVKTLNLCSFTDSGCTIPIFTEDDDFAKHVSSHLNSLDVPHHKPYIDYKGETNELASVFNDVIDKKGLTFVDPVTGNPCFSQSIRGMNLFYFEAESFFVYLTYGPKMQHCIGFAAVFSKTDKYVIFVDRRKEKTGIPVAGNRLNIKLEHSYKYTQVPAFAALNGNSFDKVMLSNRGVGHFGHAIWNDLSVFHDLITPLAYSQQEISIAGCKSYYIKDSSFLEKHFSKPKSLIFDDAKDMVLHCLSNNTLPLFVSNDYISDSTAALTKDIIHSPLVENLSAQINDEIGDKKLIVMSLRAGTRSCLNEADAYIALVKSLLAKSDDFVFAIDGMNVVEESNSSSFGDLKKLNGLESVELDIANRIEQETGGTIIKCINLPLGVSVHLASKAYRIFCPWGAGLVKYKWIENKDCFIYGSPQVLADSHPHRLLYDRSVFRQNAKQSTYYRGASEAQAQGRDACYTINVDDFVVQATEFIFNEGN